jgi:hypothetical protein
MMDRKRQEENNEIMYKTPFPRKQKRRCSLSMHSQDNRERKERSESKDSYMGLARGTYQATPSQGNRRKGEQLNVISSFNPSYPEHPRTNPRHYDHA